MDAHRSSFSNLVRLDLVSAQPAANVEFNEQVNDLIKSGRDIAHFGFGLSPFPILDVVQDALREFAHEKRYLAVAGIPELRQQISHFHAKFDGLSLDPSGIILGPGSKQMMYLLMATFNGAVLIPTPAWTSYQPQAKLAGRSAFTLNTSEKDNWKLSPETLQAACRLMEDQNKLLILTNPGNPSGVCYTEEELAAISHVCREENIVVVSDEIYARIAYSGKHASIAKFYPEGTVLSSGFSKSFSAGGWRLGYLHFPDSLKALFNAVKSAASQTHTCASGPMQYAFEKCLRLYSGEIETYTRSCSKILKAVGDYCHRELTSVGITGPKSEAGYYFMPNFEIIREGLKQRGITTGFQMVTAILEEADVALLPSEVFSRRESELSVRFCFVCFDGDKALKEFNESPSVLDDAFIQKFCPDVVNGVQRLKTWVSKHK